MDRRSWRAALLVALVAAATSGLVSGLLCLLAAQREISAANSVTIWVALWAATFGVPATGHLGYDVANAHASAHATGFAPPLTITILTLSLTLATFAHLSAAMSRRQACWSAAGAALLAAVPVTLAAAVASSNGHDVVANLFRLLRIREGITVPDFLAQPAYAAAGQSDVRVGVGVWATYPIVALVVFLALGSWIALSRWPVLRAGADAICALAWMLVATGAVGGLLFWATYDRGHGHRLADHEWTTVLAGGLAYAGNLGVAVLSLGLGGTLGGHRLAYFAGHGLGAQGLWLAPVLAVVTILVAVWRTRRAPVPGCLGLMATLAVLGAVAGPRISYALRGLGEVLSMIDLGPLTGLRIEVPDTSAHLSYGLGGGSIALITAAGLVATVALAGVMAALSRGSGPSTPRPPRVNEAGPPRGSWPPRG